jgi:hypothetical protein
MTGRAGKEDDADLGLNLNCALTCDDLGIWGFPSYFHFGLILGEVFGKLPPAGY